MSRKTSKPVTLKDVAEAANVSVMTVSNVVNGRSDLVTERTRAVVQREIDRLNYSAVGTARALRTGKTQTIAVLYVLNSLEDRFGTQELDVAFRSFAHILGEQNFQIFLQSHSKATAPDAISRMAGSVDGFLILSVGPASETRDLALDLKKLSKPAIVYAPPFAEPDDMLGYVNDNSDLAGTELAEHLASQKISKLTLIDSSFVSSFVKARCDALEAEALNRGMTVHRQVVEKGRGALLDSLMDCDTSFARPDHCIVTLNETQAQALSIDLMGRGFAIPSDIQLACVNLAPGKPYRSPNGQSEFASPITGIWSDAWRLGSAAASMLLARLKQGNFTCHEINVACTINIGHTTSRVPSGTPRLVERDISA